MNASAQDRRSSSRRGRALRGAACALIAAMLSSACATRVYTPGTTTTLSGGIGVRYVGDLPPNIYAYPSVRYRGRPAYLYNDVWYYDAPGGWVIMQDEPAPLRSYRYGYGYRYGVRQRGYVEQAPPAYYRGYGSPYGTPYRSPARPPPARRVR